MIEDIKRRHAAATPIEGKAVQFPELPSVLVLEFSQELINLIFAYLYFISIAFQLISIALIYSTCTVSVETFSTFIQ